MTFIKLNKTCSYVYNQVFLKYFHKLSPIYFGDNVPVDSSLVAAVAMAPFDSRFDPRQRRHLIHAQLVSQLIRVQLATWLRELSTQFITYYTIY